MIWNVFFFLSVLSLALTIIIIVILNKNKKRFIIKMNILFFGSAFALFLLFIPIFIDSRSESFLSEVTAVLMSINRTLRAFSLTDIDFMNESHKSTVSIYNIYSFYMSLLCFFCPFLSIGYLLSFFTRIREKIRFSLCFFKDIYVFSELNPKSIALSQDISANDPKAHIIFTGVNDESRKANNNLYQEAENINATCFSKNILAIKFNHHSNAAKIYFFTLKDDITANLMDSYSLIEKYKMRRNTHLYAFSDSIESEIVLSDIDKGEIQVRRVDECKTIINHFMYEKGINILRSAVELDDGTKQISAVLIGLGKAGSGLLKALAWYGQMDGYRIKITAFDKEPHIADKLKAKCPELLSEEFNGVHIEGEAEYEIKICPGMDVFTKSFADSVSAVTDATFVFVALGNDSINVETAVDMRKLFERVGVKPYITAILNDSEKRRVLKNARNFKTEPYDIDFIGDWKYIYSKNVIMNSELEEAALRSHKGIEEEKNFWKYEYNYNSSIAATIHQRARIQCGIPGAGKPLESLSDDEVKRIAMMEHKRWNAYMRSQGYIYSGSLDPASRNDLGKMHHNLVPYQDLSEDDAAKDVKLSF